MRKPSARQLAIARTEGGSAAFNRPKGMDLARLLALCPYKNKALVQAWRGAVRLHFGVNRTFGDGRPTSAGGGDA